MLYITKELDIQYPSAILLVEVTALQRACRQEGVVSFQLSSIDLEPLHGHASLIIQENLELSRLPKDYQELSRLPGDYQEFSDIFSKNKSKQLLPHCDYDLFI